MLSLRHFLSHVPICLFVPSFVSTKSFKSWKFKAKETQSNNEGGTEKRRETVFLFSLVWHYLSLLINPPRPSARRSEGEKGGQHEGVCEGGGVCGRVLTSS